MGDGTADASRTRVKTKHSRNRGRTRRSRNRDTERPYGTTSIPTSDSSPSRDTSDDTPTRRSNALHVTTGRTERTERWWRRGSHARKGGAGRRHNQLRSFHHDALHRRNSQRSANGDMQRQRFMGRATAGGVPSCRTGGFHCWLIWALVLASSDNMRWNGSSGR